MIQDIVDIFSVTLSVEEGESGRILIKGPFGHCEQATSNGRMYRRPIMEKNFKSLTESMGKRRLFGELDHPADGRTSLKRVSHIVTELSINEDGEVVGALEPLPTPMGNILKALAKAGCELGVSSRGRGSIVSKNGIDEVQDDYVLKTYDVVDNPASKNAFPTLSEASEVSTFLEGVSEEHREDVRAAFTEAASKIDTFTLEDIADEGLRAQVAEALGLNESEVAPEPVSEAEMTPARKAEQLKMAMGMFPHFTKSQQKKMYSSIKAMDAVDQTAKLDLLKQMKAIMGEDAPGKAGTAEESQDEPVLAELTALKEAHATLQAERNRLHESLTSKLPELRLELREDVEKTVRAELAADPQVAGAKMVLETMTTMLMPFMALGGGNEADRLRRDNTALADALKARDFDLATTRLEADRATKEAGARLMEARLSELLAGHPKADGIRKLIGPLARLENIAELESRVEVAFDALGKPTDLAVLASTTSAEASAKITALESRVADLTADLSTKKTKLTEMVSLGEEMNEEADAVKARLEAAEKRATLAEVAVYASRKVVGRKDAVQVLALCENATSKAAVNAILDRTKPLSEDEDEVPAARVRARAAEHSLEENAAPTGRASRDNGMRINKDFVVDLDEAAALAGR